MPNQYYQFLEPAKPFSTVDPRPYNRELEHVVRGFEKIPAASRMNSGTQYYARLTPTAVPSVFQGEFPSFPTSGKVGMRMFFIVPVEPTANDFMLQVKVGDTIVGTFPVRTADNLPYPEGTIRKGVMYETVFRDDVNMQLLGAGSTVLSVMEVNTAKIISIADQAHINRDIAYAKRDEAKIPYDDIMLNIWPNVEAQKARVNFNPATYTTDGLVYLSSNMPQTITAAHLAIGAVAGDKLWTRAQDSVPTLHNHPYTDITNLAADSSHRGIVMLTAAWSDASRTKAIVPAALGVASNVILNNTAPKEHDHEITDIVSYLATFTTRGIVKLVEGDRINDNQNAASQSSVKLIVDALPDAIAKDHKHDLSVFNPPAPTDVFTSVFKLFDVLDVNNPSDAALSANMGNALREAINQKSNLQHTHTFAQGIDPDTYPLDPYNQLSIVSQSAPDDPWADNKVMNPVLLKQLRDDAMSRGLVLTKETRTPTVILAHLFNKYAASVSVARGQQVYFDGTSNGNTLIPCGADFNTNMYGMYSDIWGTYRAVSAAPNKQNYWTFPTVWVRV